jgi:hypothetical protein
MPVLVVGTEKNFAALRRRLFAGRVSTTVAGRVGEAIREANPHADLDALEPGTILTVPDVSGIRLREGELSFDESATGAVEQGKATVTQSLDELTAAARSREAEDAAERKRLERSLRRSEVVEAARRDDALAADLESAKRAVEEDDAVAKGRAAALRQAREEWLTELEALQAAMPWGGTG